MLNLTLMEIYTNVAPIQHLELNKIKHVIHRFHSAPKGFNIQCSAIRGLKNKRKYLFSLL